MAIDLTPPLHRFRIGANNWTDWLTRVEIGWEETSRKGYAVVRCTANLSFGQNWNALPVFPNYLDFPNSWERGVTCTLEIWSGAAYEYHPCAGQQLFLLEPLPAIDIAQPTVQLTLGCYLALADVRKKVDENEVTILVGSGTPRHQAIATELQAAGIPSGQIELPSMPYPFDFPVPRSASSIVESAGSKAYDAGYLLYCRQDGKVTACQILGETTPFLSLAFDTDAMRYGPSQGSEAVPSQIDASAIANKLITPTNGTTVEIEAPRISITTNPAYIAGQPNLVQTVETQTVTFDYSNPYDQRGETEVKRVRVSLTDDAAYIAGQPWLLTTAVLSETRTRFDSLGRKWRFEQETKGPRLGITGETDYIAGQPWLLTTSERVVEEFTYYETNENPDIPTKSTIASYTRTVRKPRVAQTPEADYIAGQPWLLQVSEELKISWRRLDANRWQRLRLYSVPRVAIDQSPEYTAGQPWLLQQTVSGEPSLAIGKDFAPPQTEFLQPEETVTQKPLTLTYKVRETAGLDAKPLPVQFNWVGSTLQLQECAEREARLIYGRRFGTRVAIAWSATLFDMVPLKLVEFEGLFEDLELHADGFSYVGDRATAYAAFNGLLYRRSFKGFPSPSPSPSPTPMEPIFVPPPQPFELQAQVALQCRIEVVQNEEVEVEAALPPLQCRIEVQEQNAIVQAELPPLQVEITVEEI